MPIYEYRCEKCGEKNEFLVFKKEETLNCKRCGSSDLTKLLSAHNVSGATSRKQLKGRSEGSCESCCESPQSCGIPGGCCSG